MASDPTPLTATPSSARALAAAGAGERVTLRVPFETALPEGFEHVGPAEDLRGRPTSTFKLPGGSRFVHPPPVAEGERVAVTEASDCDGCGVQWMHNTVPATVLATPTPERWCEKAEMDCSLETLEAAGLAVRSVEFCRGCRENLLHVWRVEVRRDEP